MQASENFLTNPEDEIANAELKKIYQSSSSSSCGVTKRGPCSSSLLENAPSDHQSFHRPRSSSPGGVDQLSTVAASLRNRFNSNNIDEHFYHHQQQRRSSSPNAVPSLSLMLDHSSLLSRVVENVKPAMQPCPTSGDLENRGYDLYGFGAVHHNTSGTSTNGAGNTSLQFDDSTAGMSDSFIESSPMAASAANCNGRTNNNNNNVNSINNGRVWSKNNVLSSDDCDLCFYSWPAAFQQQQQQQQQTQTQQQQQQQQGSVYQFRPILVDNCKCRPCQCTAENNYCGCYDFGACC